MTNEIEFILVQDAWVSRQGRAAKEGFLEEARGAGRVVLELKKGVLVCGFPLGKDDLLREAAISEFTAAQLFPSLFINQQ